MFLAGDFFFSLSNPVIFSILFLFCLLGLTYILYIKIILPIQKIHLAEKRDIELTNAKLMALFAELDPEPLFRFNGLGEIILTNNECNRVFNNDNLIGESIKKIIPGLKIDNFGEFIAEGKILRFIIKMEDTYYDLTVKGVPELEFGQIYFSDVTAQKIDEIEIEESRKRLRELANHLTRLQEEEKQKLSRELHDNFGQILSFIKLNIEFFKDDLKEDKEKLVKFDLLSAMIDKAITGLRQISYQLKPRVLDELGLIPSLRALCNETCKQTNLKGMFQSYKIEERFNPNIETCLYRISQEALNNIIKHAKANEFSIQLVGHDDFIRLMIEDDGIGFDINEVKTNENKRDSLGIVNMSERALSLNGRFTIDSHLGAGTEIIVEIPREELNGKD
jgi:signal transduction histidine kinase